MNLFKSNGLHFDTEDEWNVVRATVEKMCSEGAHVDFKGFCKYFPECFGSSLVLKLRQVTDRAKMHGVSVDVRGVVETSKEKQAAIAQTGDETITSTATGDETLPEHHAVPPAQQTPRHDKI
eukprot:gnl/TRDRNA2_/TRDRNA2_136554_c2_seq1.p1 gnl/TRDRNA2_/TRDRNA2_136554_c2~~gnl/TRDRNA2_/TRDRNA2_136554_c2_seq1.p1  ORF type:complete len:122 (+),score=26.60 gnl/TRDRNA2_/TRDRNA2_136554_c2_seq1:308-673(+)